MNNDNTSARPTRSRSDPADRYFDPKGETMPREEISSTQEAKLLELLPYAYERSGLVRETWDRAGVHPRDVHSWDDFQAIAPYTSKDAVREFRSVHSDPYGGTLCVPVDALRALGTTSGTTGVPTLCPQRAEDRQRWSHYLARSLWQAGLRPGETMAWCIPGFTPAFAARGLFDATREVGATPAFFDHHPADLPRFFALSLQLRPTVLYLLSGPLILGLEAVGEQLDVDLTDVFSSYKAVVFGGEPLGPRARRLLASWGVRLFVNVSVADTGMAFECDEHAGCHVWEDTTLVEHLRLDGQGPVTEPGERGEMVATWLDNRTAALVRYRSDDIVEFAWEPCGCGRTHGRVTVLARKGDELVVAGRSVLPIDIWPAVEAVAETSSALFQVVRASRDCDELVLKVGYRHKGSRSESAIRQDLVDSVHEHLGVRAEVHLVPEEELLRLGPPHKIPRVISS